MNIINKLTHLILIVLITLFLSAGKVTAVEISITDNGSGSTSEANVTENTQTTVEQSNNATVENNVNSNSNSGNNEANGNTGGQTNIESGPAENHVEVTNSVNNSNVSQDCCPSSTPSPSSVTITGNGSGSTNTANVSMNTTTTVTVNNNAVVTNTVNGTANSGGNTANNNNGDVTIKTGKVSVTETIVNAVNNAEVKVSTQQTGTLNAKIAGNGALSVNTLNIINRNTTAVAINQNADVLNISNWFANSGNNTASGNVGDVVISTGDVTIATLIKNVINMAKVDITCCQPQTPPPCEYNCNPNPPCEQNCNPNNPPSNPGTPSNGGNGGNGNGGPSSGGSSGGSVLGITSGDILPATGSGWTLWLTILAGLLFALGFYLRMHPGRAPNAQLAF